MIGVAGRGSAKRLELFPTRGPGWDRAKALLCLSALALGFVHAGTSVDCEPERHPKGAVEGTRLSIVQMGVDPKVPYIE